MTAQHKSNNGCASFTCVVVDLLLCKTKIPAECPKCFFLFNVGIAPQIVDKREPSAGSSFLLVCCTTH